MRIEIAAISHTTQPANPITVSTIALGIAFKMRRRVDPTIGDPEVTISSCIGRRPELGSSSVRRAI